MKRALYSVFREKFKTSLGAKKTLKNNKDGTILNLKKGEWRKGGDEQGGATSQEARGR